MPRKPHSFPSRLPGPVVSLIAALALAGCSGATNPTSLAAPSVPAPTASTWLIAPSAPATAAASAARPTAEPDDAPPGTRTCAELGAAIKGATLMQPGVVDRIVAASSTADAPVGDAAQRLATAYAGATAAQGGAQEPDAVAAVSAAAADMDGVCNESGLESAG
jgi:hypothetical protein